MNKTKRPPNLLCKFGGIKQIFFFEFFWFFLAQVLGILVSQNIANQFIQRGEEIQQLLPSEFSILNFLISFLVVTIFLLLILKTSFGKNIVFRVLFIFITLFGGEMFFESFLPSVFAFPLTLILISLWFKTSLLWLHNLVLILGIAGIGGFVGLSLSPKIVIILFSILAVYDLIAVYKTEHMVKMAKSMVESRAVLGIIIPKKFVDFNRKLKEVKIGDKKQDFLVLGSGDIIFPLILAVSCLPQGLDKSWIILIFSLFGLAFSYWLFFKLGKKPMPALPPLALFSIIGYLVTIFL